MQWTIVVLLFLLIIFSFVILFGAPYLPTKRAQIIETINLLKLKEGQTLLELGCGDGRVLKAAASHNIKTIGYELNPLLVVAARVNTWRYRNNCKIIWGNYWTATWPDADAIYVFLLDKYMKKLDKKITQRYKDKHIKLVSFAFKVPNKKTIKVSNGLFLYSYN